MSRKTITLLLEQHNRDDATHYFDRKDNRDKFPQTNFAFEIPPTLSGAVTFENQQLFCDAINRFKGYFAKDFLQINLLESMENYFSQLFLIDSFWKKYFLKQPFSKQFKSRPELFWWFRDEEMAMQIKKILMDSPRPNLVVLVGAAHFSVFYHLLILLGDSALEVNINILNLVDDLSLEDFQELNFHMQESILHFPTSLPPIGATTAKTVNSLQLTQHPKFSAFKYRYQQYKVYFEFLNKNIRKMRDMLFKLSNEGRPPQAEYEMLNKEMERLQNEILLQPRWEDLECPEYRLGRELFDVVQYQPKHVRLGVDLPLNFMTKHYS